MTPEHTQAATRGTIAARQSIRGSAKWALLGLLALLLVAAQMAQAWTTWQHDAHRASQLVTLERGALCSVMLANGQVYYGEFVESDASNLRLTNVYYVQSSIDPQTQQPGNRLVSRRKADWHAPLWMTVPLDKVLMVEAVAPDSRLAQLVKEDASAAATQPAKATP